MKEEFRILKHFDGGIQYLSIAYMLFAEEGGTEDVLRVSLL